MNKLTFVLSSALLTVSVLAQTVTVFPDEYAVVPEGPFSSPNLPFARGTSRVQCLYDAVDLAIPSGDTITRLGFREDVNGGVDSGVALQLEIRMGWSTLDHQSMTTTFDNNFDVAPVTVFGPALYTPPDLRDPNNPLPNGQLWIDLTTPFSYVPAGRNLVVEYRIYGTAGGGSSFLYRLDRADYYSPVSYGPAGCQHSGGSIPTQTVQPTRPGLSWSSSVTSGPANAPAFIAINIGAPLATPYPLSLIFGGVSPSCTGQMAPGELAIVGGASSSSGGAFWQFQIPNDNIFSDMTISSQAVFLEFFSPGQVVVSNGAEVVTGVRTRSSIVQATGVPTSLTTGQKSTYYCPVPLFEHN